MSMREILETTEKKPGKKNGKNVLFFLFLIFDYLFVLALHFFLLLIKVCLFITSVVALHHNLLTRKCKIKNRES